MPLPPIYVSIRVQVNLKLHLGICLNEYTIECCSTSLKELYVEGSTIISIVGEHDTGEKMV